ncbi:MAG: thymidine kinase [Anaerolineaceae bacterium]|nr:thymidine kinase [Anaerolineaceae bacterium]MDE0329726.1 thymidine kinase [Anaerolineaceae bacterium]
MSPTAGRVEVICGSMFSGKTEELIRRVRRAVIARKRVQVFKHSLDDRFGGSGRISSHDDSHVTAVQIANTDLLPGLLHPDTTVVAIDEAQFFDSDLLATVETLANRGLRVMVAGLDTDFRGEPFGMIPVLMAVAEEVTKLNAICTVCGEAASRTQRLVNGKPAHVNDPVILVGASESYEARCRAHHELRRDL